MCPFPAPCAAQLKLFPTSPSGRLRVSDYPAHWVERYIERGYHRLDPVITQGSKLIRPFTWDALARTQRDTPAIKTFFAEAADVGLPNGFGLSIKGGNHASAMVSASTIQNPKDLKYVLRHNGRDMHLASLVFHTVAKDLMGMESVNAKPISLTPREQDFLVWAMRGKSAWDIANIFNITERGVRFHFANIREKLDVSTIREAVVKAYMMGIIHP